MELIGFWITCGIAAAVVAGTKGNSGCAWFFIGLLLGPIGLVLSFAVGGSAGEKFRKCPMCAELIRREAVRCRWCGSDVAEGQDRPLGSVPSTTAVSAARGSATSDAVPPP